MSDLGLELDFYPKLRDQELKAAIKTIEKNRENWDEPFFMDVYAHADISHFKEVIQPFQQSEQLKNLIIIGTGGSYQTMKAIELLSEKKIYFLTSSRPYELKKALEETTVEDSLVIPISRGGKTLDVNSILPLFSHYKILALSSRGPMNDLVKELGATILPVPDLSGRFAASVCSVALVPALLAGIDVDSFQKGLEAGYKKYSDLSPDNLGGNITLQYAAFLKKLFDIGFRNIFSMPYSIWLEGLTGLFVQEISESSGKKGKGLLGTSQPAPLCQHSVLELLLGGSKGHTTPLMWTLLQDPDDRELEAMKGMKTDLSGQTAQSVINYQLDATFEALLKQGVPSAKLSIPKIDSYSYGILISFVQTTVYYYCLLTNVNWSSNPKVNIGKKICNDAIDENLSKEQRKESRKKVALRSFNDWR